MKKFTKMLCAVPCVAMLASCSKKVAFKDFHDAATKVETVEYTKVSLSGKHSSTVLGSQVTIDLNGVKAVKKDGSWETQGQVGATQKVFLAAFFINTPAAVAESSDYTYYVGGGFKTEKNDNKKVYTTWDKFGYCTCMSDGTNKVAAKWSK